MNKASILLRKASFPPVVEEELTVLKNINPLYVIMPSDRFSKNFNYCTIIYGILSDLERKYFHKDGGWISSPSSSSTLRPCFFIYRSKSS